MAHMSEALPHSHFKVSSLKINMCFSDLGEIYKEITVK